MPNTDIYNIEKKNNTYVQVTFYREAQKGGEDMEVAQAFRKDFLTVLDTCDAQVRIMVDLLPTGGATARVTTHARRHFIETFSDERIVRTVVVTHSLIIKAIIKSVMALGKTKIKTTTFGNKKEAERWLLDGDSPRYV